jgi:hypothetical protein
MLTQSRVRELFIYDPESGVLTRRISAGRHGRYPPGSVAGTPDNYGYINVQVDGKYYRRHRLAWLYVHGTLPEVLDHANRVPGDDRLSNLRPATRQQNMQNRKTPNNNALGVRGVRKLDNGNYLARVQANGAPVLCRVFESLESANAAATAARSAHHKEFSAL